MGKQCLHASAFSVDPIFVKLAGNEDRHNISEEFEFRPDRSILYGFICLWTLKDIPLYL